MNAQKIVVETLVHAPLEAVWRTYTTAEEIQAWNAASDDWHTPKATVDLRVGGKFCSRMEARDGSMGFDFEGEYTKVDFQQALAYKFGDRFANIEFIPLDQGVQVRVSFDPETENPLEMQRAGWQSILDNFRRYTEGKSSGMR